MIRRSWVQIPVGFWIFRTLNDSVDEVSSVEYAYIFMYMCAVHLKIEEASRMLRTGDLGIPLNPTDRFEVHMMSCEHHMM